MIPMPLIFPNPAQGITISPSSSAASGVSGKGVTFGNYGPVNSGSGVQTAGTSNAQVLIVAGAVLAGLFLLRGRK